MRTSLGDLSGAAGPADQARLFTALRNPRIYPGAVQNVEAIETHISLVLLAGAHAYKVKKAVDLGFLDFSSLDARRRFCAEELRLNRRTAPDLYLDVVAITGTPDAPVLGGTGTAIEYAVRMRRFDQDDLLDRIARRGALTPAMVDAIAASTAAFHARIARSAPDDAFATPQTAAEPALANFEHIAALVQGVPEQAALEALRQWTADTAQTLAPAFAARKAGGFVRECHGDLHLGNIALIDGKPVPFDCIEFSEEFRWIDVINEIAFLGMDLVDRGLDELAWRLLSGYLERTGDYDGVAVLRFYLVYRAMVRAKVDCIRAHQPGLAREKRSVVDREFHEYLALARRLADDHRPAVVLMRGLSGSGKTTLSAVLLERLGAIRVRSDVERKRLHGLEPDARTGSGIGTGLYAADVSRRTYDRLLSAAGAVVAAGYPVVVDATFLRRSDRDRFRNLAGDLHVPFALVCCEAPLALLRERVAARMRGGRDASEATLEVLEKQIETDEPLGEDERGFAAQLDAAAAPDEAVRGWLPALLALIGSTSDTGTATSRPGRQR